MYELTVEQQFAGAHQLRGYKGRCENLHGHNWKVTVTVHAEHLDNIGLAMDFHELKALAQDVVGGLDHEFLNDVFPFTEINPSSENIAKYIYDGMRKHLKEKSGVQMAAVTVWESETASATYFE